MDDPNPFTPPRTEATAASDRRAKRKAPPSFSDRAAKISCYGSFSLFMLAGMVGPFTTTVPFLGFFFVAGYLATFVLGIVGIHGGMERGSSRTVRTALLGVVLSGILLAPFVLFVLH